MSTPSDTPEIRPALPESEWECWLKLSADVRQRRLLWAKDEADCDGYLTVHGLAALCLHGQPFGFTWKHVDALRAAADLLDDLRYRHVELEEVAARVAALLPPKEE